MNNRTRHMGVAKRLLRMWIKQDGAKTVLVNWEGTDAEALAQLDADPREVFCDCDCKKTPDGACTGEPS